MVKQTIQGMAGNAHAALAAATASVRKTCSGSIPTLSLEQARAAPPGKPGVSPTREDHKGASSRAQASLEQAQRATAQARAK